MSAKADFHNVLAQAVERLKALGFDARYSLPATDPEPVQGRLVVKIQAGDARFKWLEVLVIAPDAKPAVAVSDLHASTPCGFFYNRVSTSFQLTSDLLSSAEDAKLFTDCFTAPRDDGRISGPLYKASFRVAQNVPGPEISSGSSTSSTSSTSSESSQVAMR